MFDSIKELFGGLLGEAKQTVDEHTNLDENLQGLHQDAGETVQNAGESAQDVRDQAEGGINDARDNLGGV
jgi:hypothetical protein